MQVAFFSCQKIFDLLRYFFLLVLPVSRGWIALCYYTSIHYGCRGDIRVNDPVVGVTQWTEILKRFLIVIRFGVRLTGTCIPCSVHWDGRYMLAEIFFTKAHRRVRLHCNQRAAIICCTTLRFIIIQVDNFLRQSHLGQLNNMYEPCLRRIEI